MDQSVVYADLKFAVAPTCPTAPDEDDSPYENMPLGTVAPAPSPGNWPRRWRVPAGLLAASLLLLLVATIALGTCYWQVTRRLQDTSREHTAEQDRLSQEVSAREQSLEQTRLELAWARAELQQAWQEGNSSQLELESLNAELQYTRQEMDVLQKEMQEVQVKLNDSENTVSSLRACVNTDCCPLGWVLYRSKCLFISVEMKTWLDSQMDCRSKGAQLLVPDNWSPWTVPVPSRGAAAFPEGGGDGGAGQTPVGSAAEHLLKCWGDTVSPRFPSRQAAVGNTDSPGAPGQQLCAGQGGTWLTSSLPTAFCAGEWCQVLDWREMFDLLSNNILWEYRHLLLVSEFPMDL
ncbi:B-cell differentiation antigen CD72-like isoform X2 [Columba livia]|uniref:B-cell differentiation antigen CD72-like isoform X2 n=1 Tax=Columba livia TaxID=8932 RepID=UPI0031B9ADE5